MVDVLAMDPSFVTPGKAPMLARAGLALGISILAGCSTHTSVEKSSIPHATSTSVTNNGSPESQMPDDIRDMLRQTDAPDARTAALVNQRYATLGDFQIGARRLRVVQVGGELATGKMSEAQVVTIHGNVEKFAALGEGEETIHMPVVEADFQGRVVSDRVANLSLTPTSPNKNLVMAVVPTRVKVGPTATGSDPTTFTNPLMKDAVLSVIRPDFLQGGNEGAAVETCQATETVNINNPDDFKDLAPAQMSALRMVAQEAICNALGRAVYDNERGVDFSTYQNTRSKVIQISTNQATPGHNTFVTAMPLIQDAKKYDALKTGIPLDIGNYLEFPSVTQ